MYSKPFRTKVLVSIPTVHADSWSNLKQTVLQVHCLTHDCCADDAAGPHIVHKANSILPKAVTHTGSVTRTHIYMCFAMVLNSSSHLSRSCWDTNSLCLTCCVACISAQSQLQSCLSFAIESNIYLQPCYALSCPALHSKVKPPRGAVSPVPCCESRDNSLAASCTSLW